MTAQRLDGKATAALIRAEIAAEVAARTEEGETKPGLAVILVGDDPASQTYVRNKRKACADVGMNSWLHHLPADITQDDLLEDIAELDSNPGVHGILVQLPLPKHIHEEAVLHAIDPLIDVDCFHPENVGRLATGHPRYYPCTPYGVIELLRRNGHDPAGKEVVIVGRSNIVGKPLAMMMAQKKTAANPTGCDATVTITHTRTQNLADVCRRADILIAAVGKPAIITPDMVRPGAVVVDVGTNVVDGKLIGDVDPRVAEVAGALSPVPGGVGPMTITMLLLNTLRAAQQLDV
ncbi:MAG: bifunctional methylenetetrahydrofolate dehydrogenase/methenyltetrahydrofolate cyclohydrolase FolD [Bacteroidales bacterium]|nr:bifunctional methylenetetrahydrofolate dehydrogenase/methenyltetrahydrofolate cyclohydrolase FolD [Bacteroidales bacterium]